MQQITLEDKLAMIFGKPFLEERDVLAETADDPGDLGVDKRMAISKEWTKYRDTVLRLQDIRDSARAVGLDAEMRGIVQQVLGPRHKTVSKENPITYTEALRLLDAVVHSGLEAKIEDMERSLRAKKVKRNDGFGDKSIDPAYKKAYDWLLDETGEANPSIGKMLNPNGISTTGKLTIRLKRNKRLVLDSDRTDIKTQYDSLVEVLNQYGRNDLVKKINIGFAARSLILSKSFPRMDTNQRRYTSMVYTLRNVATEFADYLASGQRASDMHDVMTDEDFGPYSIDPLGKPFGEFTVSLSKDGDLLGYHKDKEDAIEAMRAHKESEDLDIELPELDDEDLF